MLTRLHTDHEYEAELGRLRGQLLLMGEKVTEMITAAMRALRERDSVLAHEMIEHDKEINRLELQIDDACLRILARRQPVACDLRLVTSALKLVTDLERMGDLATNICERVVELNEDETLDLQMDLQKMGATAVDMIKAALDAFMASDPEEAAAVIARDQELDAQYADIFRGLLAVMLDDPRAIYRATRYQSIAKYLERIGDHATNLAEMAIFLVGGKDVRHLRGPAESTRGAA